MDFERIPTRNLKEFSGYITNEDEFNHFIDEFGIVGVHWEQPVTLSASYFLRLLTGGSSERARGYGRGFNTEHDKYSKDFQPFYMTLLDHGAMWRLSDGSVICTAMPYGDPDRITDEFNRMVSKFEYPGSIRMEFLGDEFRYRPNGDFMIVIYADEDGEGYIPGKPFEELKQKVVGYSSGRRTRMYTTTAYVRNQYVSEFAKRRANGNCQLCGKPAPFVNHDGIPFLEAHHIIPLSEGGADSIDNIAALCPNCHRKMHVLELMEEIQFLLGVAKKSI